MILALKYVLFYRVRSLVFIAILSLTMALPFISETISRSLVENVNQRTESSPVILTRRAGKVRQALSSLFYISGENSELLSYGIFEEVMEKDGLAVPLLVKHATKQAPLIATEIDYFLFRKLELMQGSFFTLPGDVVVGRAIAEKHKIKIGDQVKIQSNDMYDITNSAPIDLVVTGILDKSFGPDDSAIFTSLQTIWVLEGYLHSHSDQDPYKVTSDTDTSYSKSLKIDQDLSEKNMLKFHYHSETSSLPITHVIFRGNDHKSEVLLIDEYNQKAQIMAFRPAESLDAVVDVFLGLEQFFATYHLFWSICTLIMIALVFGLIIQTRKEEFRALIALGASPNLVWLNLTKMILIYLSLAAIVALAWHYSAEMLLSKYYYNQ